MIKVLIVDDHPVVRRGIRQILEDDPMTSLIDEASDGKELLIRMRNQIYDIILLDITLPGRSGLDLIGQIKKIQPSTAVLILSMHSEEMYAIKALRAGASGYISKSSIPDELMKALNKVLKGARYISTSMADRLTENLLSETGKSFQELLSPRESEVLSLIASGKTVSQIAKSLSLSPKTISTYRERLLEKLKLETTSDLIRYAILEDIKEEKDSEKDSLRD